MLIPRNIIEEIAQRNDILEVVGSYVRLQRSGSTFKGLCPFHSEKTPSFTIFPADNSFYCFGCGAGGDVITFIMKAENLDFSAAAEYLANRAGIRIPTGPDTHAGSSMPRKRVYEINLAAARFFRDRLFDPEIGQAAMRYLTEGRGLPMAVIRHFGLGYAPNSFDMLGNYLRGLGYSTEELKKCYLVGLSQRTGKPYDLFRNRIIFPIIDSSGNVIAFGGRSMDDTPPKYLNSADTPGFKKSRNLYALNYARKNCAESMILCEGYMDVIALHAAGFENAVATLGTAITPEQARVMARYTKKVIIAYDSDAAGQNAADRAMRLLGEVGLEVRVLKLSGAKDPDEYIKKFGTDKFRLELEGSKSGFEHKFISIIAKYDTETAEGKIKAAGEVCEVIADVGQSVERDVYISYAAERLGLSAESIKNDVERIRRRRARNLRQREGREVVSAAKYFGDKVNPDAAKNVAAAAAEEVILGLLLLYDEYRDAVGRGEIELSENDFFTSFGGRVFSYVMELHKSDEGFSYAALGQYFTADEAGRIQSLIRKRSELDNNNIEILRSAVQTLMEEKAIADAERSGDKFAVIRAKREKARRGQQ
ncbi:MAG: DNA primase [Eubacteriales bacterium]